MTSLVSYVKMSKENKLKAIKKAQYNINKRVKRIEKNPNAVDFGVKKYRKLVGNIKGLGTKKLKDVDEKELDKLYKKLYVISSYQSMTVKGSLEINKKVKKTMGEDLYNYLGSNEERSRWWISYNNLLSKFTEQDPDFDYNLLLETLRDVADPINGSLAYKIVDSDETDMNGDPIPKFVFYKDGEEITEDGLGAFINDSRVNLNSMRFMRDENVTFKAGVGYTKNKDSELSSKLVEMNKEIQDSIAYIPKKIPKKIVKKGKKTKVFWKGGF